MTSAKVFPVLGSNQTADSLDSIIIKGVTQRDIHVKLSTETAVSHIERMTFLTLQVRITLTDKHRVLIVKIRV